MSSVDLDPSKIPNNVIEYNLFETLTNEQKNELRMMEGESLEAFRSLIIITFSFL